MTVTYEVVPEPHRALAAESLTAAFAPAAPDLVCT